jgi:hypothetical protein
MGNPNWTKGVSGNPGGQRKIVREVREAAQLEGAACVEALAKIRDEAKDPHAVVAACKVLLEQGCGKPAMSVDITHTNRAPTTRAEVEARIAEIEAERRDVAH